MRKGQRLVVEPDEARRAVEAMRDAGDVWRRTCPRG
jgi:hypothetical protein